MAKYFDRAIDGEIRARLTLRLVRTEPRQETVVSFSGPGLSFQLEEETDFTPEQPPQCPRQNRRRASTGLAERYRVLLDIGHKLARTLSPEELYRSIYKETTRVLEATGFYVALYDRDADRATVVFYADQGVEQNVEITYRGSESDVLRLGRSTMVFDRAENLSLMVLGEEGTELTRSAISVPLLYEGEVIGALSTQSYQPNAYTEGDLELFQAIADLAVVAINNSQHVTELMVRQGRRSASRRSAGPSPVPWTRRRFFEP